LKSHRSFQFAGTVQVHITNYQPLALRSPKEENVWLRSVEHVVHPPRGLLHTCNMEI